VPGPDERRPARYVAARPSAGTRRYPLLIGALMALAVVPTAALVMAGTHALDSALDERRPFVADRANGPVVVGPDGVPDGPQRRPPVDGQPQLTAPLTGGPSGAGPPSRGSGSSSAPAGSPSPAGSPPSPSPSVSPESGRTGGRFDLDLGIIHIHVG
jgi:hypothetical protein